MFGLLGEGRSHVVGKWSVRLERKAEQGPRGMQLEFVGDAEAIWLDWPF